MKKAILTATVILSLATVSFGYGLERVNGFSSHSFPPPTMKLAS